MAFEGIFTALVTPFKNGEVDENSLGRLIDAQMEGGVHGLVLIGTTAESPTLTSTEKKKIFEFAKSKVGDSIPLVVGTGSNCTASTIQASKEAVAWGADGLLVVVPYYNKPSQRGLSQHFKAVAESVKDTPLLLYNVPARTVASLDVDTVLELSKIDNIVGIKEATGDIDLARTLASKCPEGFLLSSGDDPTFLEFLSAGGNGLVSVISNLLPRQTVEVYESFKSGNKEGSKEKFDQLLQTVESLGFDSNPVPIKTALKLKGLIDSFELRLPLLEATPEQVQKLESQLAQQGLLS